MKVLREEATTFQPHPQLYSLLAKERSERLRADAAARPRRLLRRRFGEILVAAGERLVCEAPPQPRHSTQ